MRDDRCASKYLRRFMKGEHALDLLKTGKLALTDPQGWEDKNDIHTIDLYAARSKALSSIRVCCFTGIEETFHHWKVFASKGVCVIFEHAKLARSLAARDLEIRKVRYRLVPQIRGLRRNLRNEDLPYLKWGRYQDEREFRVVSTSQERLPPGAVVLVPIALSCIKAVIVSPFQPARKAKEILDQFNGLLGSSRRTRHIKASQSYTTNSCVWKNAVLRKTGAVHSIG